MAERARALKDCRLDELDISEATAAAKFCRIEFADFLAEEEREIPEPASWQDQDEENEEE